MAKELVNKIKLQVQAGKATAAPPVGTALGPAGINIGDFCTRFNDQTKDKMGDVLPVEISVYNDKSFDFIIKTPPTAFLLKRAAKVSKASAQGAKETVATITKSQLKEIAETKLPDLNAYDVEGAMKIIEGTARNMGVAVEGVNDKEMEEQAREAEAEAIEAAKREAELEAMEESSKDTNVETEVIGEKEENEDNEESQADAE